MSNVASQMNDGLPVRVVPAAFFWIWSVMFVLCNSVYAEENSDFGFLHLTIIDAEIGEETPARVEVLNEAGESFIAEDALPIAVNYTAPDEDAVLVNESLEVARSRFIKTVKSPYTGLEHFYSIGASLLKLPEGVYNVRVFKGPEYFIGTANIKIEAGTEKKKTLNSAASSICLQKVGTVLTPICISLAPTRVSTHSY